MRRYAIVISQTGVFFENANSQMDAVLQLEGKKLGITAKPYDVFHYSVEGLSPKALAEGIKRETDSVIFANQRKFSPSELETAKITVNGKLVTGFSVSPDGSIQLKIRGEEFKH